MVSGTMRSATLRSQQFCLTSANNSGQKCIDGLCRGSRAATTRSSPTAADESSAVAPHTDGGEERFAPAREAKFSSRGVLSARTYLAIGAGCRRAANGVDSGAPTGFTASIQLDRQRRAPARHDVRHGRACDGQQYHLGDVRASPSGTGAPRWPSQEPPWRRRQRSCRRRATCRAAADVPLPMTAIVMSATNRVTPVFLTA